MALTHVRAPPAWQAAQQALAALGTESSDVPRHMWSVIIGAGGANIRRIESESGARLQLEEEPEPHLKIQGMPEARKVAKALVRICLYVYGMCSLTIECVFLL